MTYICVNMDTYSLKTNHAILLYDQAISILAIHFLRDDQTNSFTHMFILSLLLVF